jgi:hypothetical protein
MALKNRLKCSRVIIFPEPIDCDFLYIGILDKNIDGYALMKLTDDDLSQLLAGINEDGSVQELTIGLKSRFRIKLMEWKIQNEQETKDNKDE